jgi:hypothetical protein
VVDAVIENNKGVEEATSTIGKVQAEYKDAQEAMVVNMQLKYSNILSKTVLKEFAGKDVTLNVTTKQNNLWSFDCKTSITIFL